MNNMGDVEFRAYLNLYLKKMELALYFMMIPSLSYHIVEINEMGMTRLALELFHSN